MTLLFPNELFAKIFSFTSVECIIKSATLCKHFSSLIKDDSFWINHDIKNIYSLIISKLKKIRNMQNPTKIDFPEILKNYDCATVINNKVIFSELFANGTNDCYIYDYNFDFINNPIAHHVTNIYEDGYYLKMENGDYIMSHFTDKLELKMDCAHQNKLFRVSNKYVTWKLNDSMKVYDYITKTHSEFKCDDIQMFRLLHLFDDKFVDVRYDDQDIKVRIRNIIDGKIISEHKIISTDTKIFDLKWFVHHDRFIEVIYCCNYQQPITLCYDMFNNKIVYHDKYYILIYDSFIFALVGSEMVVTDIDNLIGVVKVELPSKRSDIVVMLKDNLMIEIESFDEKPFDRILSMWLI